MERLLGVLVPDSGLVRFGARDYDPATGAYRCYRNARRYGAPEG